MRAMSSSWGRGSALAIAGCLAACTTVANEPATDPSTKLDETVFRCLVEPVLVRQCSYPACHGNAGTPLRIYSPGKLRITRPKSIDDSIAPLTDAEHHANFASAAGFSFGVIDPLDNLLLRKTTPPAEGGFSHLGGVIFPGTGDPQYHAIFDWLRGQGACP